MLELGVRVGLLLTCTSQSLGLCHVATGGGLSGNPSSSPPHSMGTAHLFSAVPGRYLPLLLCSVQTPPSTSLIKFLPAGNL